MSSLTVCRTESQLAATNSFQAMDNLMSSSVSSSFVVPSGVNAIKNVEITTSADAAQEYCVLVRLSGNGMSQEQFVSGAAFSPVATGTGTASNYVSKDVDFPVTSGNSIEIGLAVTDDATISAAVVLTFSA